MNETVTKALVLTILRHAEDFRWRMQDIGLLALRLDDRRECRLHVWDPTYSVGEPPVHDHPYDFTSRIVVGEMTNTRYGEHVSGDEYVRFRYPVGAEEQRSADTVRLSATATRLGEGSEYRQLADELHASSQLPGTVTVIESVWVEKPTLTVCFRDGSAWCSPQARDATPDEIKRVASIALERF